MGILEAAGWVPILVVDEAFWMRMQKGVCKGVISFLSNKFFQLHGCMVSHMQVLATPSTTLHNTKYSFCCNLTNESILVLTACS